MLNARIALRYAIGAVATAVAIRMYHLVMDSVIGLTGMAGGGTAAPAAR